VWPQELLYSHGFPAVEFLSQTLTESDAVWRYPANRHVVNLADGVIVHSDYSKRLAKFWYGSGSSNDWSIVPLLREPIDATAEHKRQARAELGFADGDFVVAAFGMIGPTKLNDRLLDSFLYSSLGRDERCRLVFVGELAGGAYGDRLRQRLDTLGDERRYSCTGRVDARLYRQYLLGADVAVQLRTTSRGETSAAVHDCMNARTPVVVNAHGAVVDLPSDTVLMIPDTFTDDELGGALKRLREDEKFRSAMVAAARQLVSLHHRPDACAAKYAAAIERSVQHRRGRIGVSQRLRQLSGSPQAGDVAAVARSLAGSLKPPVGVRQLLVDVSELTLRDAGSGIQRVTRELLARLLRVPHEGWHVEPVYASAAHSYRYARRHLSRLLPNEVDLGPDLPIDVQDGDVFLGLDLAPHTVVQHAAELRRFRARGAKLHFVVYDLLPVTLPEAFFPGAATDHERWLSTVASLGDLVCISRSVAGEVERWLEAQPGDSPPPKVGWFPLGADFSPAGRVAGIPSSGPALLRQLDARPSFLIVGTLEPRKCHAQVLAAFDLLWGDGVDVNLVIVGKQGWMVEDLIDRIRTHPEFEARLLWVPDASDEFLDMIMMFSEALIAASRGEGFGLPVVEALRRSVPVIARDIPVFREVGGDTTTYFDGLDPAAIAKAVEQFLNPGDQSRRSAPVTTTWDESAEAILRLIGVR
jgi:glycosyltransferase involved in cell wall biosynthesis